MAIQIKGGGEPIERGVTKPVTKSPRVTKSPIGLLKEMVSRVGRPRVHLTGAAKQKAYRERRRHV